MAKVLFINPIVREEEAPKHVPMGMAQLSAIAINLGQDHSERIELNARCNTGDSLH